MALLLLSWVTATASPASGALLAREWRCEIERYRVRPRPPHRTPSNPGFPVAAAEYVADGRTHLFGFGRETMARFARSPMASVASLRILSRGAVVFVLDRRFVFRARSAARFLTALSKKR